MKQIFFKNYDADIGILSRLCVQALIYLPPDNWLLYMDAPHKPVIYLRLIALVYNFTCVYPFSVTGVCLNLTSTG